MDLFFDTIETSGRLDYIGKFKCVRCGYVGTIHEQWTQEETEPDEQPIILDGIDITKPKYGIRDISNITIYNKDTNDVLMKFDTLNANITLERKEV